VLPSSASKSIHYYTESVIDIGCCIGGSGIEEVLRMGPLVSVCSFSSHRYVYDSTCISYWDFSLNTAFVQKEKLLF
jgi:hypothetical protein